MTSREHVKPPKSEPAGHIIDPRSRLHLDGIDPLGPGTAFTPHAPDKVELVVEPSLLVEGRPFACVSIYAPPKVVEGHEVGNIWMGFGQQLSGPLPTGYTPPAVTILNTAHKKYRHVSTGKKGTADYREFHLLLSR